ncbi:SHOCT domain-containing protein [Paenibacillus tuaregi]|uniref:SHOCT domain-containing protein n=1 Tax=Paenibacillus tuaregi TaxID=1816681 RepID=UPI0008399B9A|nr:SHOCT domain-containing protein [Paenibacillus tuaregi]
MKTKKSTKTMAAGILALSLTLGGGVIAVQHTNAASAASTTTQQNHKARSELNDRRGDFGQIESQLLTYLKLDETTFKEKIKTQTLAEIASSQGISRENLKAKLVELLQAEKSEHQSSQLAGKSGKTFDASAVADKLLDSKLGEGFGGKGFGRGPFKQSKDELAKLFGMTADELSTQLESGKTLAAIAGEHNVTVQAVIDLETSSIVKELDSRLDAGQITQAQYDTQKAKITERVTELVNNQFPDKGDHGDRGGHFKDIAALLGVTEEQLRTELQSGTGTTLASVAAAHNVTAQQVIDLLVKDRTAKLDEQLAAGKITQTEYDKLKTNLSDKVTKEVNNSPAVWGKGDGKGENGGDWGAKKAPEASSQKTKK